MFDGTNFVAYLLQQLLLNQSTPTESIHYEFCPTFAQQQLNCPIVPIQEGENLQNK